MAANRILKPARNQEALLGFWHPKSRDEQRSNLGKPRRPVIRDIKRAENRSSRRAIDFTRCADEMLGGLDPA